jgi:hypothetical protein
LLKAPATSLKFAAGKLSSPFASERPIPGNGRTAVEQPADGGSDGDGIGAVLGLEPSALPLRRDDLVGSFLALVSVSQSTQQSGAS